MTQRGTSSAGLAWPSNMTIHTCRALHNAHEHSRHELVARPDGQREPALDLRVLRVEEQILSVEPHADYARGTARVSTHIFALGLHGKRFGVYESAYARLGVALDVVNARAGERTRFWRSSRLQASCL